MAHRIWNMPSLGVSSDCKVDTRKAELVGAETRVLLLLLIQSTLVNTLSTDTAEALNVVAAVNHIWCRFRLYRSCIQVRSRPAASICQMLIQPQRSYYVLLFANQAPC